MPDNKTILQALQGRRSIWKYTPEKITSGQIAAILEAGRWAPSAANHMFNVELLYS